MIVWATARVHAMLVCKWRQALWEEEPPPQLTRQSLTPGLLSHAEHISQTLVSGGLDFRPLLLPPPPPP